MIGKFLRMVGGYAGKEGKKKRFVEKKEVCKMMVGWDVEFDECN